MSNRLKTWLITGGVVLALCAGAVLSGFAIAKMTGAKGRQEDKSDMPEVPTAPTDPVDADVTEAPTSAEPTTKNPKKETNSPDKKTEAPTEPSEPDTSAKIHELTSADLSVIRGQYAGERKNYYAGGAADSSNRPISCNKFSETFTTLFGESVHIYQSDEKTILDALSAQGVMATFFVNRSFAEKNPAIIQRIINEGHTLGSLGATFPDSGFSTLSLEEQMESALSLQNYIRDTYGYEMKYFNFVHDDYSEQSLALLTQMGYQVVYYSVKYADYSPTQVIDINDYLDTVKRWIHPGVVYNFHTTNPATLNVVPQLITYLRDSGYTVGPLN